MTPDCYASPNVFAVKCEECEKVPWDLHRIGDGPDPDNFCPEHCPVCSQEGERRRGAKKGGAE